MEHFEHHDTSGNKEESSSIPVIDVSDVEVKVSRASGAGGQNVNKRNTRVQVRLHIEECGLFSPEQIALLQERLHNRITKEGVLIVSAQESRTQGNNETLALSRLNALIREELAPQKERVTKTPRSVKRKQRRARRKFKEHRKEIKDKRKKPDIPPR